MPDKKTLSYYTAELRRIEESRQADTEKEIKKIYKELLKDLNGFLGNEYASYSDDNGVLSVAVLQEKARYAKFLQEVDQHLNSITPKVSKTIRSTVEDTYKAVYTGTVDAVTKSVDNEEFKKNLKGLSLKPEVMKRAVENPISGLTLPDTLEKHRKEVIYNIKQQINIGLMTGERYDTMAKNVKKAISGDDGRGGSYGKAMNIVRTEVHRVQESGMMDCAEDISPSLEGSGLVYTATWRNMGDLNVRPSYRVHTSKGWKTVIRKTKANHQKMEGQTIRVGDKFDLGNGVFAKCPGSSGTPENDCRCRCIVEYELMTVEEFAKATGKTVEEVKKELDIIDENIEKDVVKDKKIKYNNIEEHDYQYIQEADLPTWRKCVAKCSEKDYKQIYAHDTGGYIRTSNSFKINAALRNKAADTLSDDDRLTISTLKRVISENATDRDIILDRYVDANYIKSNFGFAPEESGNIEKLVNRLSKEFTGSILVDKGFVSTSFSEENVFTWRPIKLKIQAPKGTNMFATQNYVESEVILNTETKMKLISATKNANNQIELVLEIQSEV